MENDPNKGWRDGIIEQFESKIPPILKTGGKPCIPVSSFWSHTQESGKSSPPVSPFQVCSEGEVFSNQEKTETEIENDPEPLMGLSSIFVLLATNQIIWGSGLGFIVISIIALYFLIGAHARRQEKKRMIQNSLEKKETPVVEFFKQEDNIENDIGLDGAAYPPLQPIKYK